MVASVYEDNYKGVISVVIRDIKGRFIAAKNSSIPAIFLCSFV